MEWNNNDGYVSVYEMGGDRERKRGLSLSCKAMGMGLREREGKRSIKEWFFFNELKLS